ncbi:hypothetical protein MASR1M107_03030 [Ignavibacteriales bacterium]
MKHIITKLSLLFILGLGVINAQALSGTYYIPQGANPQGYASLAAACDAITANGANGVVTFIIDGNLTETAPSIINNATFTASNRLVIKPAATKQPTVTFTAVDAANHFFYIVNSSYVTLDGSNGNAGDGSRDMTFAFDFPTGRWAIEVQDNSDFITIQNLKVISINTSRTAQAAGIAVDGSIGTAGVAPNDILISNCQVGTPTVAFETAVGMWGNDPTSPVTGTIIDCDLYGARRVITTFFIANNKYINNRISVVDPRVDMTFYSGIYLTGSVVNDTTVIAGNKFTKIDVNTTTNKFAGAIVVYGNTGVINVVNNFIAPNFNNLGTATANKYFGVAFGSATWNGIINIAHNTFRIDAPATTGINACIGYNLNSDATMNVANNIFHQGNSTPSSYLIHFPMTVSATNILNFDWNNYYLAGIGSSFGFYGSAAVATLNDWKTAISQDANSNYKMVNFVSNTDLHLTGASNGDWDLRGMPIASIKFDIDGNPRNTMFPYKGAHEASISLPVELTSFTALQSGETVVLDWTTATETNNLGFEVERSTDGLSFNKIGFVKGAGSTTDKQAYKFVDNSAPTGTIYYRLRQIDLNGEFAYSNSVEVDIATANTFSLQQNFPNPFNPSTTIKFSLPTAAKVNITVYDMMGSEVTKIADKDFAAGSHQLNFNAANLASGSYIYTITATSVDGKLYKETKKMQLLK